MAELDASVVDALNTLLEDERACVEMEISFANGATEPNERDAFMTMGADEVAACCALRELLAASDVDVSRRINGIVLRVLDLDSYEERLRACADHQVGMCQRMQELRDETTERETRALMEALYESHARYALWRQQRADAFANSRLLDFRGSLGGGAEPSSDGAAEPLRAESDVETKERPRTPQPRP